jgi:hypothetical protein
MVWLWAILIRFASLESVSKGCWSFPVVTLCRRLVSSDGEQSVKHFSRKEFGPMRIVSVTDLNGLSQENLQAIVLDPHYSPTVRMAAMKRWKVLNERVYGAKVRTLTLDRRLLAPAAQKPPRKR